MVAAAAARCSPGRRDRRATREDETSRRTASALLALAVVALAVAATAAGGSAPTCLGREATVVGTAGDDELSGTDTADVVAGLGGNDRIAGGGGGDRLCGGPGDDVLLGQSGADRLLGGDGRDSLAGAAGRDELGGGPRPDTLAGEGGNDELHGAGGADDLLGGTGADWIDGGPLGQDRLRGGQGTDACANGEDVLGCEALARLAPYEVARRGTIRVSVARFARRVAATYADGRGWSRAGIRFRRVRRSAASDFTVVLATADKMTSFSNVCSPLYSCRAGRYVVVNQDRWRYGVPHWTASLLDYRRMVINHETGHWLGLGHRFCPARGALAPVMQQQSISLQGCRPNAWPKRREVAAVRVPLAGATAAGVARAAAE